MAEILRSCYTLDLSNHTHIEHLFKEIDLSYILNYTNLAAIEDTYQPLMSQISTTQSEPDAQAHNELHHSVENYEGANKEHFDKVAHKVDENPVIQELVTRVTKTVKENFVFDPESTVLLDYACGTGMFKM